ncbi:MAG TPA: hypothetical protein PLB00_15335, partial [Pseudomonadota bacterium]|nr:hypothetical protein [Pseudomonadota bacterium]
MKNQPGLVAGLPRRLKRRGLGGRARHSLHCPTTDAQIVEPGMDRSLLDAVLTTDTRSAARQL